MMNNPDEQPITTTKYKCAKFNANNPGVTVANASTTPHGDISLSISLCVKVDEISSTPEQLIQIGPLENPYGITLNTIHETSPKLPDTNWHNIIITYDWNNGIESLYMDGELVASREDHLWFGNYDKCFIGMGIDEDANGYYPFTGYLREICVYGKLLTDEEISSLASGQDVTTGRDLYFPLQEDKYNDLGIIYQQQVFEYTEA